MRPVPIPDVMVPPGARTMIIAPPSGDLTDTLIAPVDVLIHDTDEYGRCASVRCVPEGDDLERLAAGGAVWITFMGPITPFGVQVIGSDGT